MSARYAIGDALSELRKLDAGSVDLVVTSPPYLALRSYLAADDPAKQHEMGSEPNPGAFLDALLDVTEEIRRVLAPHGSIAIELGDTYSGSGGAGGDYNTEGLREGQPKFRAGTPRWDGRPERQERTTTSDPVVYPARGSEGWPLDRSLCLIPESFRFALVYGRNPFTGRETPRWRVRNVVRHFRPNPPVGALGDKFRPATSEWVVACVNRRYFDLDAVRQPSDYDRPNLKGQGARNGDAPPGQRPNTSDHTVNMERRGRTDRAHPSVSRRALRHIFAQGDSPPDRTDVPEEGLPGVRQAERADHQAVGTLRGDSRGDRGFQYVQG